MPFTHRHSGFSLVELVLVIVIMGIVGAIAIPRLASATENVKRNALRGNLDQLQRSAEYYAVEHADRGPEIEPDGSLTSTPKSVAIRLMRRTDAVGAVSGAGVYGPYMRQWPCNPYNGLFSVRIDGPPAGANLAGWRLVSASRTFESDHDPNGPAAPSRGAVDADTVEASP